MKNKELCDCGKVAVWCYMPGYSSGHSPYSCDDCISSSEDLGCSCNWHYSKPYEDDIDLSEQPEGDEGKDWRWVEHPGDDYMGEITKDEGIWIKLDEKGRPHPCAEFWYDEEGFEIEENNEI